MDQAQHAQRLAEVAGAYARTFASHEGQIVLQNLRELFRDRTLVPAGVPADQVIARAAQHDVVIHVEKMVEVGNANPVAGE